MRLQALPCICECGHEWKADIPVDCPMRVSIVAMQQTRCPECHSPKVDIQLNKLPKKAEIRG